MMKLFLPAILGALLWGSAGSSNAGINSPHFLINLLPASTTVDATADDTIYTQSFLPLSAVKTTSDLKTTLKTHIIAGGKGSPVTIPAGTIFIEAEYEKSLVYCTTIQQKKANWLGAYDLGVCLKDTGKIGKFTDAIFFLPPAYGREKVAYQVYDNLPYLGSKPRTETIDVGFETVAVDDTFKSDVQILLHKSGSKLVALTRLQYAERLDNEPTRKTSIGAADTLWWPRNTFGDGKGTVSVVNIQDKVGELALGLEILAKVTILNDDKVSLDWLKTYPTGPARLSITMIQTSGTTSAPIQQITLILHPTASTTFAPTQPEAN